MRVAKLSLTMTVLVLLVSVHASAADGEVVFIHITGRGSQADYILDGETEEKPVTVAVGQTVRWANDRNTTATHTATSTAKDSSGRRIFNTGGIRVGESADVLMDRDVFTRAGGTPGGKVELVYFCIPHGIDKMRSVIVLDDSAKTTAALGYEYDAVGSERDQTGAVRSDVKKVLSVDALEAELLPSFPGKALISARGTVLSTGWKNPRLVPYVYIVPPADGIYEFDYVANAPSDIAAPILSPVSAHYIYPDLTGVKGFRVYASSNRETVLLDRTGTEYELAPAKSSTAPDLPLAAKRMLAAEPVRLHHHLWHLVRNRRAWSNLSPADRRQLTQMGWRAPRFDREPGSGLDFLHMHRQMIRMMDDKLAEIGDAYWDNVSGWDPIPWSGSDPEWPVPVWTNPHPDAAWARRASTVARIRRLARQFRDEDWLRRRSLDQIGIDIEWTIHGWMHLRWSGPPPSDTSSTDLNNDWLFIPWSSHVNKHFWKLHGWIDERIGDWERATGETADFSNAWAGPPGVPPRMEHSADLAARDFILSIDVEPMIMRADADVLESVLPPQE